jgi:hypothetical protein
MEQKTDLYSCMNTSFLRELAENINLSFRSHTNTEKETLVKLLNKKISPEKADIVFKMYLTCFDAKDVAQVIRPKGMEEIIIAVERIFNRSECLYEVTVDSRRCDVVFLFNDETIAVEVKSAQDKMKTVTSQLDSYMDWANKVFLAYDVKHRSSVEKLGIAEKGIGLIEFNKGKTQLRRDASCAEKNAEYRLSLMTYDYLRKTAKTFGVGSEGRKQDLARRLIEQISQKEAQAIFRDFLKTRALR